MGYGSGPFSSTREDDVGDPGSMRAFSVEGPAIGMGPAMGMGMGVCAYDTCDAEVVVTTAVWLRKDGTAMAGLAEGATVMVIVAVWMRVMRSQADGAGTIRPTMCAVTRTVSC
ncbi:hypothetical protein Vretifemale_20709 [Volvox reticuliferus]|uniref:Uncharacterized protein n=1 Tax=Volvox reticuliferus TaxID=1737510 RepID=A0A8J4G090_9CHLO|nr:hypothetical protein Vretifemale_20709 [Volvox reticuliferus]